MSVRPFSREQDWLLPPRLDDLLPKDHAARFVACFVDSLGVKEWQSLGISLEGEWLGAPLYHPRALLSVWLYGFMTRTRSTRKLEAACRDQIPYLWLTGWQHPDHNTLWRFYKEHRLEMRHLFKHSIRVAVKLDLIDLAVQAVDGTKVAANASKDRTYDAEGLRRLLARTDEVIRELEEQNEAGNDPPAPRLPEKLEQARHLSTAIKTAMVELEQDNLKRINLSDADAKLMKTRQGTVAGYNVQSVVSPLSTDETQPTTGLIITAIDAVAEPADARQLTPMMEQAEENTDAKADSTLADAGYHSGANLADCRERKQVVVMPESQDRALRNPYHKDKFNYNTEADTYTCPEGQTLKYVRTKQVKGNSIRIYHSSGAICRRCKAFGQCTTCSHHGRELQIGPYDALLKQHRAWMATEAAKTMYARRKELVEPAFGIIKEQMGFRQFLLRGLGNVRAEATLIATAFNLRTLCHIWRSRVTQGRGWLLSRWQIIEPKPLAASLFLWLAQT